MLQAARDAVSPGLMADVPVLPPYQLFHDRNGIIGRNDATGVIAAKHWNIVQMISSSENFLARDSQLPRDFSQPPSGERINCSA